MDKQKQYQKLDSFFVDPVQLKQYECNINAIEMLENQADKYETLNMQEIQLTSVPVLN